MDHTLVCELRATVSKCKKENKLRGIPRYNVEFQGKSKQGHPDLCKGIKIEEESVMSDSFHQHTSQEIAMEYEELNVQPSLWLSPFSRTAGVQPLPKEWELPHPCRVSDYFLIECSVLFLALHPSCRNSNFY